MYWRDASLNVLSCRFSQTLSIPPKKLSGLPLKSEKQESHYSHENINGCLCFTGHLYQRPSRPTVLEPLNHISPVNFDIPVWPSAQSPKLGKTECVTNQSCPSAIEIVNQSITRFVSIVAKEMLLEVVT